MKMFRVPSSVVVAWTKSKKKMVPTSIMIFLDTKIDDSSGRSGKCCVQGAESKELCAEWRPGRQAGTVYGGTTAPLDLILSQGFVSTPAITHNNIDSSVIKST